VPWLAVVAVARWAGPTIVQERYFTFAQVGLFGLWAVAWQSLAGWFGRWLLVLLLCPAAAAGLAAALDPRSAPRLARLFLGALLARGRRTVTSWIRAAGLSAEFRPCYTAVAAAGTKADLAAAHLAHAVVTPLVAAASRLTFALDDTPTPRYGPRVQGAGTHHNPAPGPAGSPFVYGHVWVVRGLLAAHPAWGTLALPLLARLYVRQQDLAGIPRRCRPPFRTKLELAVELVRWAVTWL
jgi:hypothetical protein